MLDTVVEDPFEPQPQGNTLNGHHGRHDGRRPPDLLLQGLPGRALVLHRRSATRRRASTRASTTHLKGAISWATGQSDPVYSDCGATVLKNYQQVKVSAPPNLLEPIGFDQLPDGRLIQTSRSGTVRLHDPVKGTTTVLANFADPALPTTMRLYTNSEDGLYGPAVDNNFATNHWVYLYYAPQTVTNVKLSDGSIVTQTTPNTTVPNAAASQTAWDPYVGYFQLSRFKFVDDAPATRRTWTSAPSSRSCGSPTTARSAATSRVTSTSTRTTTCGWSRVTTRRPAASTPTATARSRTS